MNTTVFWLLAVWFFAFLSFAEAQQPLKLPRIGFLSRRDAPAPTSPDPLAEAFRQGLRDFGYVDGKTIQIEYRYAGGNTERLPTLVAELMQLGVDVLVSATLSGIRAAKQATTTIPIVMVTPADPVATGLIESLARPGGNITGLTRLTRGLSGKRLEVFKEAVPKIERVGILNGGTSVETDFQAYESAARHLQLELQSLEVRGSNPDFEGAFQAAVKGRVNAIIAVSTSPLLDNPKRIADLALKHRLPSMHEGNQYVNAGGLMSYAANDAEQYRRAAYFVDKILRGAKPADLPVEQPTKFELAINLKTAKQIGLKIPPNVLARANRVIK